MRNLVFLFVLFLAGVVVAGFYRGWFQLSTDTASQRSSATISVDKDKIHEDEKKVQSFGQEAKEKIGGRTGKVQEPERRP